jgi:hypothetical protein
LRQGSAGEDARTFAGADGAGGQGAGGDGLDDLEADGKLLHVRRPDGIAVHRGDRLRGMRQPRGDRRGEDATERLVERHDFGAERHEGGENPVGCFLNGEHHSASKVPDLPPLLCARRISVMRMVLSTAFTMS